MSKTTTTTYIHTYIHTHTLVVIKKERERDLLSFSFGSFQHFFLPPRHPFFSTTSKKFTPRNTHTRSIQNFKIRARHRASNALQKTPTLHFYSKLYKVSFCASNRSFPRDKSLPNLWRSGREKIFKISAESPITYFEHRYTHRTNDARKRAPSATHR